MSLLKAIKTDSNVKGEEKDSLGGGGLLDSDAYLFTIEAAYVIKSEGGAMGISLQLKNEEGRTLRTTEYITNKKGENFYEKEGQKSFLPGYNKMTSLTLLAIGKELSELDTEEKVIKAWNFEAKAEVPTKVQMITDLVGKQIYGGVLKQTVDKNAKADDGTYKPTGETRDENVIDKFFRARDKMTVAEIRAEAEKAEFFDKWVEANKGKVVNRAKGAGNGTAGAPKAGAPAAGAKPKQSLFG